MGETLLTLCFLYFPVMFHTTVHTKQELLGNQWFRLDQGNWIPILVSASTTYIQPSQGTLGTFIKNENTVYI